MAVPPLIDREIVDAVQARLKSQSHGDARAYHQRPHAPDRHLLLRQVRRRDDAPHRHGQRGQNIAITPARRRLGSAGCTIPMDKLDDLVATISKIGSFSPGDWK